MKLRCCRTNSGNQSKLFTICSRVKSKGTLKRSIERIPPRALKTRQAAALTLVVVGAFCMASSLLYLIDYGMSLTRVAALAIGGALFVAGLIVLVTELMEAMLSRGQSALVDGLQAG